MTGFVRYFFRSALCFLLVIQQVNAEETSPAKKPEEVKSHPETNAADSSTLKRAKLTNEQAINQLKFMMIKGFDRMEKELLENGSFPPFGMTLSPEGEFKAVVIDAGNVDVPSDIQLAAIAKNMEAIAKTRAMWAVGLMYIRAIKLDDGSYVKRIVVMAEHIAGWARHWVYPFKVEEGVVKLGQPAEAAAKPIYYVVK